MITSQWSTPLFGKLLFVTQTVSNLKSGYTMPDYYLSDMKLPYFEVHLPVREL